MRRHATVFVVIALLLAGCVGGQGGTAGPTGAETTTDVGTATETTGVETASETTDGESSETRTAVEFYVSDEENAMGDFAHLNVTITEVGLKRAGDGDANWTTYDVDNRTVDLTRLAGANATRLGTIPVRDGTYETVFVHVGEVNGTLTNGDHVRVKLPSEKLQIHQTFTVGANESVDYVFDISVFEAGKSGKYILKPVISESGTDQEIEVVDEREDDSEEDDEEDDDQREDESEANETETENEIDRDDALNATFVGNVTRGENATVAVTRNESAVANATVEVSGETVGETGADGTFTFAMPNDEELEVEIETEDESVTLEKHFGADESDDEKGNGNGGN